MPLYEFSCRKCGHRFEELVALADMKAGLVKCPACQSKRVEKGLSSFATGQAADSVGGPTGGGCGSGGFT
jgi:putative FmdB family regulatory protein